MITRSAIRGALDRPTLRSLVVETNDGVIATASVVEGFAGAGLTGVTMVLAGLVTMVAGSLTLAGGRYAEEIAEREAALAVIAEEQAALSQNPEEELAELSALFEAKGVSPALARGVAEELSARDALAAHLELEHRMALDDRPHAPIIVGVAAGVAFVLGAVIPLIAVGLTPDPLRGRATFVAALVALGLTSVFLSRTGATPLRKTLRRTLMVASTAMLLSLVAGWLLEP